MLRSITMSKRSRSLATMADDTQKDFDVSSFRLERFLSDLPTVGEVVMMSRSATPISTTQRRTEDMKLAIRDWEEQVGHDYRCIMMALDAPVKWIGPSSIVRRLLPNAKRHHVGHYTISDVDTATPSRIIQYAGIREVHLQLSLVEIVWRLELVLNGGKSLATLIEDLVSSDSDHMALLAFGEVLVQG
ncbi:uncharacterized protein CLUP02_16722 [Colletotrichum lupini]|uniref:Uncharacterized protein n=1 Tax=Colletotrichum lupini TaxID=145971 RepID=A0A9Q8T947_9PEZI|nr:uncharacterized protein CLUP02_16722 [Colletotrichum lupini]UQC91188.1 hypothetical protein CLUP02_16722 [Colletotrichum lupini]